jgi:hypothetical protein
MELQLASLCVGEGGTIDFRFRHLASPNAVQRCVRRPALEPGFLRESLQDGNIRGSRRRFLPKWPANSHWPPFWLCWKIIRQIVNGHKKIAIALVGVGRPQVRLFATVSRYPS